MNADVSHCRLSLVKDILLSRKLYFKFCAHGWSDPSALKQNLVLIALKNPSIGCIPNPPTLEFANVRLLLNVLYLGYRGYKKVITCDLLHIWFNDGSYVTKLTQQEGLDNVHFIC